ncbi:hypothetical protein CONPUDRAFT_55555, partial [Coniophora puteana RWD-64-598 SS2]
YRCEDCLMGAMVCSDCLVQKHETSPFHRIKYWNGQSFERTTLKRLGLRLQLGHGPGTTCINPVRCFDDDFVVIDSHGIHEIGLDYCGCETAASKYRQLLRARLFPATVNNPKTAATFRILEEFQLLSFESKASAYEAYHALARRSDNTGLVPIKDRYEPFMRMVREWRHLKMLKRSGRGHHVDTPLDETPEGACAVLCPACPQPGKNMPPYWEKAPKAKRWLHGLFLAMDANFRLKRRKVSSEDTDPSLGDGITYMVKEKHYKEFLSVHVEEPQDKSTCASHKAVNMANTKAASGLAATGLATIDCARHGMKMPCGCGDVLKGEKYAIMDYLKFSSIRGSLVRRFNISYDVACQWWINLWSRVPRLPPDFRFDPSEREFRFLVPKFHLGAHIPKCQINFSFNFTPGVGRTDGEAVERGWANINPVASSTKEMGPGNRRDTLDAFFGDWNWKKLVGLGPLFKRRMKEAVKQSAVHSSKLEDMEANFPKETIASWTGEVEAWESDHTSPNPFEEKVQPPTLPSTRLKIARDDARELAKDPGSAIHLEITPGSLVNTGIELDELHLGQHTEDTQRASLQQRLNALQLKLNPWFAAQSIFVPIASSLRLQSDNAVLSDARPDMASLYLPSSLPKPYSYPPRFYSIEWDLRVAQAHDALARLHSSLRYKVWLHKYKDKNLRGQLQHTRHNKVIEDNEAKIQAISSTYKAAYTALLSLKSHCRQVIPADIRPLKKDDVAPLGNLWSLESEGRRTISWIWRVGFAGDVSDREDDAQLQDELRVEWCKARARAHRWSEEKELLREEMHRVLRFLEWQATWWEERVEQSLANSNSILDADSEGLAAYGYWQAALRRSIAANFSCLWGCWL